jgi:glutaredoxin
MTPMTETAEQVTVYWIPGCANCVRVKGYLARHGIDFRSVNVQQDLAAVDEMKRQGIGGLPVVRIGDRYAPGVDLAQVDALLGLGSNSGALVPPTRLATTIAELLDTDARFASALPQENYDDLCPGMEDIKSAYIFKRDGTPYVPHRTYLGLIQHIIGHGAKFDFFARHSDASAAQSLEFAAHQGEFSAFGEPDSRDAEYLSTRLTELSRSIREWSGDPARGDGSALLETFNGPQTVHQVMQTMTCGLAQHSRQLASLLDRLSIERPCALDEGLFDGLNLPTGVWS